MIRRSPHFTPNPAEAALFSHARKPEPDDVGESVFLHAKPAP